MGLWAYLGDNSPFTFAPRLATKLLAFAYLTTRRRPPRPSEPHGGR
jgi:hypothetical protein